MSATSTPNYSEKRSIPRFALELPILLNVWEGTAQAMAGQTRDISSQGVCFLLDADASIGSTIDFVLTLPTEVTMTEPIRVRCRASVLRTEIDALRNKKMIAAKIHRYEFIPPEMA
ncbi:MAG TPA: PilZ domain-containing protein [candidate division Zixibacteria bacterium]|nr:PilZ domain-containing protein [candidate division Zixibacteria bacterium]